MTVTREEMRTVLRILYSNQSDEEFEKCFNALTDEDLTKIESWIKEAIELRRK